MSLSINEFASRIVNSSDLAACGAGKQCYIEFKPLPRLKELPFLDDAHLARLSCKWVWSKLIHTLAAKALQQNSNGFNLLCQ
jgi:hypothetical protein